MADKGRLVLGILAGILIWAVLWNVGTRLGQVVFPTVLIPDQPVVHVGALLGLIFYSVLLSLLAGYIAGAVGGLRAALILSGFQLAFGIIAEVSYWQLMPVWYHLIFLSLVIPATVTGGLLRSRSGGSATHQADSVT